MVSQKVLICHPELVSGSLNSSILLDAEPILSQAQHKVHGILPWFLIYCDFIKIRNSCDSFGGDGL
jgi:hypothetical protein